MRGEGGRDISGSGIACGRAEHGARARRRGGKRTAAACRGECDFVYRIERSGQPDLLAGGAADEEMPVRNGREESGSGAARCRSWAGGGIGGDGGVRGGRGG